MIEALTDERSVEVEMHEAGDPSVSDVGPIAWFSQLDKSLVDIAGGKGANLGELVRSGFPVPPGFVVTAPAYLDAMDAAGIRGRLSDLAADCGTPRSRTRPAELQALIRSAGMPPALRAAIVEAYAALGDEPFVAVRSSATAEDAASTSFAGMNETYTNVRGPDRVDRPRHRLLGVALRPAGVRVPSNAGNRGRACDRGSRPAHGRCRTLGRDVHRRPRERSA